MNDLHSLHVGETVSIVGRGPSLLRLNPGDFPDGPVITLNGAIRHVRDLRLPNIVYTFQKDGCVFHDGQWSEDPWPVCAGTCGTSAKHDMVEPIEPERLIVSKRESAHCFESYPLRYVVDVQTDLDLPWATMSAPCAVRIAFLMGASSLLMLGHDAYTVGDMRRVEPSALVDSPTAGYLHAGRESQRLATELGMGIRWVAP